MFSKTLKNLVLTLLVAGAALSSGQIAEAQLVVVTSPYRVVSVDRAQQRIGVALPDANPNKRQTWIYVKPDTRASMRKRAGNGFFDEQMSFNGIFDAAQARKGSLIKVHGGRDFDGSIDAKTVWF